MIVKNPVSAIEPPTKISKVVQAFNSDEIEFILANPNKSPMGLIIAFQLFTGLRRGELLALKWSNIDFTLNSIIVCQTQSIVKGGMKLNNTTKSKRDRIIPITDKLNKLLTEIKAEYPVDQDYIFCNKTGKPIAFKTFHDRYKKYFANLQAIRPELRYMTPHKLRHTFATYMLRNGTDIKSLQVLLEHSNLSSTQIYVHSDLEHLRDCCENLSFK